MSMLYTSGVFCKDRTRKDYIKESFGVVGIRDKMKKHQLRWLGHVMKRRENGQVRAILGYEMTAGGAKIDPSLSGSR